VGLFRKNEPNELEDYEALSIDIAGGFFIDIDSDAFAEGM